MPFKPPFGSPQSIEQRVRSQIGANIANAERQPDLRSTDLPAGINPKAPDYRLPSNPSTRYASVFIGSYKIILVLVGIGVFLTLTAFKEANGKYLSNGLSLAFTFFFLPAFLYWSLRRSRRYPHIFLGATDTPPPDLSPPGSGNMRATIQRRQAAYRDDNTKQRYVAHELLCWLYLSETAFATAKEGQLLDEPVFSIELSDEFIEFLKLYDPEAAQDKFLHYTLREFLEERPLMVKTMTTLECANSEQLMRQGLARLNETITAAAHTPSTSTDTFEL